MTDDANAPGPFSHLDGAGRASMVDVSAKSASARQAIAEGAVYLSHETLAAVREARAHKGDVLSIAEFAGIMGAKRTDELIPLCHSLGLDRVRVWLTVADSIGAVAIQAEVATSAQTGVEMEALTAVSVAALTVYDMVKAQERGARIGDIGLIEKRGGKSGTWWAEHGRTAGAFAAWRGDSQP